MKNRWEWQKEAPEKTGIGHEKPTPPTPTLDEQKEKLMPELEQITDADLENAEFDEEAGENYTNVKFIIVKVKGLNFKLAPAKFPEMPSYVNNLPLTPDEAESWRARFEKWQSQAYA